MNLFITSSVQFTTIRRTSQPLGATGGPNLSNRSRKTSSPYSTPTTLLIHNCLLLLHRCLFNHNTVLYLHFYQHLRLMLTCFNYGTQYCPKHIFSVMAFSCLETSKRCFPILRKKRINHFSPKGLLLVFVQ